MSFIKYVKRAFANRWNLLMLFGGLGFGLLSGLPEVALPLIAAGEILYVGLLSSHSKFQRYVDAQDARAVREEGSERARAALERMLKSLPKESFERFEALRNCCLELRQIARGIKSPGASATEPLEDLQLAGLDRLLWMFLRLSYTEYSLERFLKKTTPEQINREIARLEAQLRPLAADVQEPQKLKIRKTLEDNLSTCRDRQANLQKATDNLQLVRLELDRLENKIRSLSEVAINRQEPEFISGQVDQVASSLLETERTMNDLRFATGLDPIDDAVPQLLRPAPLPVKKKTVKN